MGKSEILSPATMNVFHAIFGYLFAILGSIVAWIALVSWLFVDQNGGLGKRDAKNITPYFNWHPFCMSFAFILIMFSSLLSFEIFPFSKRINKTIHGTCHTLAFISAIIGLSIILDCHLVLSDKGIFKSVHSIIGFMTLSLFTINYLHGLIAYFLHFCRNNTSGFFGIDPTSKSVHKRIGLMVIIGGSCNILIGITEKLNSAQGKSLHIAQAVAAILFMALMGLIFSLVRFQTKGNNEFLDGNDDESFGRRIIM